MRSLSDWKKVCHRVGPFAALAVWLGIYQACATAPAPVPLPQSPWGGKYAYSYELPTNMKMRAPGSVPVTIAVVNPSYKEAESALGTELYTKVGKGLSSSMGGDLDKILISKGFTTTGPFPSLAEITYSEKKGAALALAPIVFVTVEIRNSPEIQRANWTELGFAMNVTGWMTFVMEEPLSGQKMWIKKLQLDSVRRDGVVAFESIPEYGAGGCGGQVVRGYKRGEIVYDGRADAMATALKEMYPVILTQFEKYIDADELVQLKEKVKEIREQKVY